MHPAVNGATNTQSLAELLYVRLSDQPDRLALRFLDEGTAAGQRTEWTRGELHARVSGIVEALLSRLQPGDRALLVYPPGLDFVAAFYACLASGVVAVPAYPPDPSRLGPTVERLRHIAADSGATLVLSTAWITALAEELAAQAPALAALPWLATDTLPACPPPPPRAIAPDATAFLQYTSGSTGRPKGVVLRHENILANLSQLASRTGLSPEDSYVGWLPTFHDMGLLGHLLLPLRMGSPTTLMSPVAFMSRPLEWLHAITRFQGTTAAAPDFGYALCARKAKAADIKSLDLRCWHLALNGAERIRVSTIERFVEVFGPAGFRRETFFPAYGLAEATVFVTGAYLHHTAPPLRVDRRALQQRRVEPSADGTATVLQSAGLPDPSLHIRIVDPDTLRAQDEGALGEIWLCGPNVASAYFGGLSPETFTNWLGDDGPYLRTGDLGLLQQGQLYVAGRIKDLIILRGRNHYPEDLERTVEGAHPSVRPGGVAAFAVERDEEERLGVAVEVGLEALDVSMEDLLLRIRQAVVRDHEVAVQELILLTPRSLPKTSSGKIQRSQTRTMFVEQGFEPLARWSEPRRAPLPPLSPTASAEETERWLLSCVADTLSVPTSTLDSSRPFAELGVDSLLATELAGRIEESIGRRLDAVELWNHPSIAALARHLRPATRTQTSKKLVDPLDDLLGDVEALSDADAAALLGRR